MSVMFLPLRLIPVQVQCVVMTTVLDLVFARDETLKPLLHDLNGRVFRIHITDTGAVMYLGFARNRAWVHSMCTDDIDVRLSGSTAGFARMCFGHEDPDDLVFLQVLKLSGDSESMLRFKKLLQAADIDWERELRAGFGEYFGSRVAQAAKALVEAEAKASSVSHETIRQCLKQMEIPDQERFEAWQAGVEDATRKISRLKARITRLEKSVQSKSPAGKPK